MKFRVETLCITKAFSDIHGLCSDFGDVLTMRIGESISHKVLEVFIKTLYDGIAPDKYLIWRNLYKDDYLLIHILQATKSLFAMRVQIRGAWISY